MSFCRKIVCRSALSGINYGNRSEWKLGHLQVVFLDFPRRIQSIKCVEAEVF